MLKSLIPVVLLGAAMCMAAAQQEVIPVTTAPPPHTISVTGSAERMVPPDLAIVTLAIQTQAVSLGDAVQQNNVISARGTEAIKKVNVPNLTLRTLGFDVQRHPALVGELHRVGQEVGDDLAQPDRIAAHLGPGRRRDHRLQRQPLVLGLGLEQAGDMAQRLAQVEGLVAQFQPAGLDARQIEHVR